MKFRRSVHAVLIFICAAGIVLALTGLFLFHHPASTKALVESYLSSRFGGLRPRSAISPTACSR